MVSTGRGSAAGVLFKTGEALQRIGEVDTLLLDKTGTLTRGQPEVLRRVAYPPSDMDRLLVAAAAVERLSEHPLAWAIVRATAAQTGSPYAVEDFQSEPGSGTSGVVDGRLVVVGSRGWLAAKGFDTTPIDESAETFARDGSAVVYAAMAPGSVGAFALADPVRDAAEAAVSELLALGLRVVMLTGDRQASAERVARSVGITEWVAEMLPSSKLETIRRYQREGHIVAMVGDGINDGPALAQADVGVAIDAADVALLRNDLRGLASAIRLSRQTLSTIKQNLFWAFVYNLIGVPIAAGVLYPAYGVLLSPVLASAAMAFSSVSVVTNSLRLRRARL
jgi:Cu+-exporting ATPase